MTRNLYSAPGPAYLELVAALADSDGDPLPTPCTEPRAEHLADNPARHHAAAFTCRRCPVLALCAAAATEVRPTFGAWAGQVWQAGGPVAAVLPDDGDNFFTQPDRPAA